MPGCNRTTLSLSHKDSSKHHGGTKAESTRSRALVAFALATALSVAGGFASKVEAQTPPPPPSTDPSTPVSPSEKPQSTDKPQSTEGQTRPQSESVPPGTEPQAPLQQYLIQQPGRPLVTPATPPGTSLPPWTPPAPPAPSQTNLPAPLFVPGAPGGAPAAGIPGLTIPGAFGATTTTFRGATLEFHPTLRLSEEYSDNFFQTTSRTQDNFRSTLGPGFRLLINGARTFGTAALIVDLVHDTAPNSGDEVKVFPSLAVAIRYALTPRLALTFTETFIRNDAPAAADQFGIRRGRETFDTNSAGVTADWLLGQIATQAYYRNVLFFNEGTSGSNTSQVGLNQSTQSDTVTNILGLNASTRILTDYVIRAGYEFSKTDTLNGSNSNSGIGGDTTSHTGFASASRLFGLYTTAGLSTSYSYQTQDNTKIFNASVFGAYGVPSGLSLSAAVGYSILNSDTQDNEGTVSVNALVSYRFTRAVISVGALQDFQQTAQQGQNFGTVETRSYFGNFLYQITPFINATVNARYSEATPTGTGNIQTNQTQTTLTYGAALNWLVLRWLTASLRYDFTKQTGTTAFDQGSFSNGSFSNGNNGGNFKENRVTLNLFATF
jgi:hypothetical protein